MAVIDGGTTGSLLEVGAGPGMPAHVTAKPVPHDTLGHYRLSAVSGILAATLAASSQVFYVRWTDATRFLVLLYLRLQFQTLTLFTAAQQVDFGFDLHKVTAVSAGAGGTDLGASVKSKMRASMAASLLDTAGLVRISTTAALTALTTLDALPIAQSLGDMQRMNPAAATEEQRVNDPTLIYRPDVASGEYPLTLSQNEGFCLRNRTVWPAAGTGMIQVEMAWAEVTAY